MTTMEAVKAYKEMRIQNQLSVEGLEHVDNHDRLHVLVAAISAGIRNNEITYDQFEALVSAEVK